MVSVIIPVYNREKYIAEAIESVLAQSYTNLEVIVADDGSTDGTALAVERYRSDKRVRYFYRRHSGKPSATRNTALRQVRGRFVSFLDSDDILAPESIRKRVEVLERFPDVGIVCTDWLDFIGEFAASNLRPSWVNKGKLLEKMLPEIINRREGNAVVYNTSFLFELFYAHIVSTSSVMARRELISRAGTFDETMTIGEDRDMWLRLGRMQRFAYILEPLSYARTHATNITSDKLRNFVEDSRVVDKFYRNMVIRPKRVRERFHYRIAEFYFDAAWQLYNANKLELAKDRFKKAARFRPSLKHVVYSLIAHLPIGVIPLLRQTKRILARLLVSETVQEGSSG